MRRTVAPLILTLALGLVSGLAACATRTVHTHSAPPPLSPRTAPDARSDQDQRPLWIEPLYVGGDAAILFANESFPIEDAIARALERAGYAIVPLEERRVAIERMRSGFLPEEERQCAPMPPAAGYLEARFAGLRRLSARLDCMAEEPPQTDPSAPFSPGCVLRAELYEPNDHGPIAIAEAGRRFPLGVAVDAIVNELDRHGLALSPPPQEEGAGTLFGLGGLGIVDRRSVIIASLDATGAWDSATRSQLDALLEESLAPLHAELSACESGEPRFDHWANDMQMDVGPDGRVERCEPQFLHHHPDPAMPCQCRVIAQKLHFGPSQGMRRLRFALTVRTERASPAYDRAATTYAYFRGRQADDESVFYGDQAFDRDPIVRCLTAQGTHVPETRVLADIDVGADGRTRGIELRMMTGDTLTDPLLACVRDSVTRLRSTCPFSGRARVRGEIDLGRVRIGGGAVPASLVARIGELGIELPSGAWQLDVPREDAPLFFVTMNGAVLDANGAAIDPSTAVNGEELRVIADARAPVARIIAFLRTHSSVRRVFFAVQQSEGGVLYRVLHVADIPPDASSERCVLNGSALVHEEGEHQTTFEDVDASTIAAHIDPHASTPVALHVSSDEVATAQLLRVMDGIRSHDRRAILDLAH